MQVRQSSTPVNFGRTRRADAGVMMTSGRAGKVIPLNYIPLLRGDSASGMVAVQVDLAPMPRPLLNQATVNLQAWFVPKSAYPQFSGYDEFMHSYQGADIKALGAADRTPPAFFNTLTGADLTTVAGSELYQTLGIHLDGRDINTDIIDGYGLIHNFRQSAHTSKLTRRDYATENLANATALARAFWPSSRLSRIVPDYERALVVGDLDLDVTQGRVPITYGDPKPGTSAIPTGGIRYDATDGAKIFYGSGGDFTYDAANALFADIVGSSIGTSLADIDKARTTQAFAKLRAAYNGNDATGFDNDSTIVAELMQGFSVPEMMFKRPWLLDSKRVPVGMVERHSTDSADLNASTTEGQASASLSINVPKQDVGGYIFIVCEIVPERLYERQNDDVLHMTSTSEFPDALRDIQRTEPVDQVLNRRVDAKHTTPSGLFGYEPMNDVWNREYTRLGGDFYQATPGTPWTEQRSAIWQADIVDPGFTSDHWLCPADLPHNIFADTLGDAAEIACRHNVVVSGLTQIGDVLHEDNSDYLEVAS